MVNHEYTDTQLMFAGIGAAVLLAVIALVLVGSAWVRSQWYVGTSNGSVAVYQGVSTFPSLATLVTVTDIPVADLPPLEAGLVTNGISAQGQAGADAVPGASTSSVAAVAAAPCARTGPTPSSKAPARHSHAVQTSHQKGTRRCDGMGRAAVNRRTARRAGEQACRRRR